MLTNDHGRMVVSRSSDPHVEIAYGLAKELNTHNGMDTGARKHLAWAKRTAHKLDRRKSKEMIAHALEEIE